MFYDNISKGYTLQNKVKYIHTLKKSVAYDIIDYVVKLNQGIQVHTK